MIAPRFASLRIDRDVPIPLTDGTVTHADVIRPAKGRRFPVILERTPYDKSKALFMLDPFRAAASGFSVVLQDVRGRYSSGGAFSPFHQEIADGFDTVEWCAFAPFSNGRVGMIGASYVGATQWLAAVAAPPSLRCIVPQLTSADYYDGWTYRGGALEWGFMVTWLLPSLAPDAARRLRGYRAARVEAELVECLDRLTERFWTLPLRDLALAADLAPYFHDWLEHPTRDAYWEQISIDHGRVRVPSLNMGGWYDSFRDGTLKNFHSIRGRGASPEARDGSRLLMGPWVHTIPTTRVAGAVDFGVRSSQAPIPQAYDVEAEYLRFFDRWLRDGGTDDPRVRYFVLGENRWREAPTWPDTAAVAQRLYLRARNGANSLRGDGWLDSELPGDERADIFVYDPRDPVPTAGGALCCAAPGYGIGVADQRSVEARNDVLVYTTPPLDADREVQGLVTATVWMASSAVDADVTLKLVDVRPDGFAANVVDSVLRAGHMLPFDVLERTIDEPRCYAMDVGYTSYMFRRGHSIRVEVSSSNFPRFDRNLGTPTPLGKSADYVISSHTVLHDAAHPSFVSLPVLA